MSSQNAEEKNRRKDLFYNEQSRRETVLRSSRLARSPKDLANVLYSNHRADMAFFLEMARDRRLDLARDKVIYDYDTVIRNAAKRSLGVPTHILGKEIPEDENQERRTFGIISTKNPLDLRPSDADILKLGTPPSEYVSRHRTIRRMISSPSNIVSDQPFRLP